jgi:hypothetical protein
MRGSWRQERIEKDLALAAKYSELPAEKGFTAAIAGLQRCQEALDLTEFSSFRRN